MADINRVIEIHTQYKKGIIKKLGDNFSGIAVGYKFVGEKRTEEVCLQVFVKKKLSVSELPSGAKMPDHVWEVKTDVIEAEFTACDYRWEKHRPAFPGISIGHKDITAGTLGAVIDSEKYMLSNNHVLANVNGALIGDNILQPGVYDGGVNPTDKIGTLYDFEPIRMDGVYRSGAWYASVNYMDAAIALADNSADLLTEIYEIGTPVGFVNLALGDTVTKSGRTTGITTGIVTSIRWTGQVGYGYNSTANFDWQFLVFGTNIVAGGDSGSAVTFIDQNGRILIGGLLFAGNVPTGSYYIASPIDYIANRFSFDWPVEGTSSQLIIPSVTTQQATNVSSTSCTCNGNITLADGISRRGFCYKVGNSTYIEPTVEVDSVVYDDFEEGFGKGSYTKNIPLTVGTDYLVRAYIFNNIFNSTIYGETVLVSNTKTRYEEYNNVYDNESYHAFFNTTFLGQTFIPSITHKIKYIRLKLFKSSSPGIVTVSIRATDVEGLPTGNDLCSGTFNANTVDFAWFWGSWYEISLGNEYSLQANTKYAIIIQVQDINYYTSTYLYWRMDGIDPIYSKGRAIGSNDSGTTWFFPLFYGHAEGPAVFMFEEWGDTIQRNYTNSLSKKIGLISKTLKNNKTIKFLISRIDLNSLIRKNKNLQILIASIRLLLSVRKNRTLEVLISSLSISSSKRHIKNLIEKILSSKIGLLICRILEEKVKTFISNIGLKSRHSRFLFERILSSIVKISGIMKSKIYTYRDILSKINLTSISTQTKIQEVIKQFILKINLNSSIITKKCLSRVLQTYSSLSNLITKFHLSLPKVFYKKEIDVKVNLFVKVIRSALINRSFLLSIEIISVFEKIWGKILKTIMLLKSKRATSIYIRLVKKFKLIFLNPTGKR